MAADEAIRVAGTLVAQGKINEAVHTLLQARAFEEAAEVLANAGRFLDAGHLLLDALGVGTALVGGLEPKRKKMARRAADHLARGGDAVTSSKLFIALGEAARAAETLSRPSMEPPSGGGRASGAFSEPPVSFPRHSAQVTARMAALKLEQEGHLPEALTAYLQLHAPQDAGRVAEKMGRRADAARLYDEAGLPYEAARLLLDDGQKAPALEAISRVPRDHPQYRVACLVAIDLAAQLGVFDFKLDQFLSRFVREGPSSNRDVDAFYALGSIYASRDFTDSALEAWTRVEKARPGYRDVRQRIAALNADTAAPKGAFDAVVHQDAAFHGLALSREERDASRARPSYEPDLSDPPELPDLPDLPPLEARGSGVGRGPPASRSAGGERAATFERSASASVPEGAAPAGPLADPRSGSAGLVSLENLPFGTVIGERYRVEARVGLGGMAAVYQVTDLELGEHVALKLFFQQSDPSLVARFKQEVTLSRQLAHVNIVRLYDIGVHRGYRFLTMELLRGTDLRSVLAAGPVPLDRALRYLIQTCSGLAAAHERGVVHRDLKPENLFVTTEDVIKVMDFGIAKGSHAVGVTAAGFIAGTPAYMSPEQFNNFTSVTHLSDIYSLGIIAYELFTGRVPFDHHDLMALFGMHANLEPEPLRARAPDVSAELEDVVLRLLEKQPTARIQSCREAEALLREVASQRAHVARRPGRS